MVRQYDCDLLCVGRMESGAGNWPDPSLSDDAQEDRCNERISVDKPTGLLCGGHECCEERFRRIDSSVRASFRCLWQLMQHRKVQETDQIARVETEPARQGQACPDPWMTTE